MPYLYPLLTVDATDSPDAGRPRRTDYVSIVLTDKQGERHLASVVVSNCPSHEQALFLGRDRLYKQIALLDVKGYEVTRMAVNLDLRLHEIEMGLLMSLFAPGGMADDVAKEMVFIWRAASKNAVAAEFARAKTMTSGSFERKESPHD